MSNLSIFAKIGSYRVVDTHHVGKVKEFWFASLRSATNWYSILGAKTNWRFRILGEENFLIRNLMFGFKEKIELKTFVWDHFLPILEEMVKSESGLLQQDIDKNDPPINSNKEQTEFEIFLLFLNASGRSLSQIAGFEGQVATQFSLVIDEIFKKKFTNIKLNPQWLDKERGIVLSDTFNYYKNKMTAYHSVELSYNKDNTTKEDLHKKVSEIFFSLEANKINEPLITAMGELHKGGFMYLLQKLSAFSKKYRIVLE